MAKRSSQLKFKIKTWGGKRKGAGRPNRSGERGHVARTKVTPTTPLHVTWRLKAGLGTLRQHQIRKEFERSVIHAAEFGVRFLHFSIQGNHIHAVIETRDNPTLTLGLKSFGARFGKALRRRFGGAGPVFADRYHLHVLKTPTEMKRTLAYVLQNAAKHQGLIPHLDTFSSAPYFKDWKALLGVKRGPVLKDLRINPPIANFLSPPRSWLAREGWRKVRLGRDGLRRSTL